MICAECGPASGGIADRYSSGSGDEGPAWSAFANGIVRQSLVQFSRESPESLPSLTRLVRWRSLAITPCHECPVGLQRLVEVLGRTGVCTVTAAT
jgi:hypothetical protein